MKFYQIRNTKFTNSFHPEEFNNLLEIEKPVLSQQVTANPGYVVSFDEANDEGLKKIDKQIELAREAKAKVDDKIKTGGSGVGEAQVGSGFWSGFPILGSGYRETELGKLQNDATKLGSYHQLQGKLAEIEASLNNQRLDYITKKSKEVADNRNTGLGADLQGQYSVITKGIDKTIAGIQADAQKYVEEYRSQFQVVNTLLQGNLSITQANVQGLNQRLDSAEKVGNNFIFQAKINARTASSKKVLDKHVDYEEAFTASLNLKTIANIEALGKGLGVGAVQVGNSAEKEWDEYYRTHKSEVDGKVKTLMDNLPRTGKVAEGFESADNVLKMLKSKHVLDAVDRYVDQTGVKEYHEVTGVITNQDGGVKRFLRPSNPTPPNAKENSFYFSVKIDESQEIIDSQEYNDNGKTKLRIQLKGGEIRDGIEKRDVMYQLSMNASGIDKDSSKYMYMNYYTIDGDKGYQDLRAEMLSNRLNKTGKGLISGAGKLFEEINDEDSEAVKKLKEKYKGLSPAEKERKTDLLMRGMEQLYEGTGNSILGINIGGLIKMLFTGELFEFFKVQRDVKQMNKQLLGDNPTLRAEQKTESNLSQAREILLEKTIRYDEASKNTVFEITPKQAADLTKLYENSRSVRSNFSSPQEFIHAALTDAKSPVKLEAKDVTTIMVAMDKAKTTNQPVSFSAASQNADEKGLYEKLDKYQTEKRSAELVKRNDAAMKNPDLVLDPAKAGDKATRALADNMVAMVADKKVTSKEVTEFVDLIGVAINKKPYPVKDLDGNPNITTLAEVSAAEKEQKKLALTKLGFDQTTVEKIVDKKDLAADEMVAALSAKYKFSDDDKNLLLNTLKGVTGGSSVPPGKDVSRDLTPADQEGFSRMVKSVLYH